MGELRMVVDLPVVRHDDAVVLVGHRLRPAGEVDDAQPDVRESDVRTGEEPVAVGSAVPEGGRHAREGGECDASSVGVRDAGDPAH